MTQAFRFYDVITALSLGTAPLSTAPAAGCLQPFPPMNAAPASPLRNVDTLLGMATTLWPVMHRLSSLLSLRGELESARQANQSSKVAVLRSEYDETSHAIEVALTQWQPCLPPGVVITTSGSSDDDDETDDGDDHLERLALAPSEATSSEGSTDRGSPPSSSSSASSLSSSKNELDGLQSILHNAMAYRHSASVYLYRTIYQYAPGSALVQRHTHRALRHCVATVSHGGPMGALLWPLFVAACEAQSGRDRELAGRAFREVELRQGMNNIEQAWSVVKEVWARSDASRRGSGGSPVSSSSEGSGDEDCDAVREPIMSAMAGGFGFGSGCGDASMEEFLDDGQLWRKVSAEMGVNIVFG